MGICYTEIKKQCSTQNESYQNKLISEINLAIEEPEEQAEEESQPILKDQDQVQTTPINNAKDNSEYNELSNQNLLNEQTTLQQTNQMNQTLTSSHRMRKKEMILQNYDKLHEIFLNLKNEGIISDQPISTFIEQQLKQSQRKSLEKFINSSPKENQKINRAQSTQSNQLKKQMSQNSAYYNIEDHQSQKQFSNKTQQILQHQPGRQRIKRFTQKYETEKMNQSFEQRSHKTQRSILKKKDSWSVSKLSQKKKVQFNESDNVLFTIPKVQKKARSYRN